MFRSLQRIWQIITTTIRFGLEQYLPNQGFFRLLRIVAKLHPQYYLRSVEQYSLAVRIRLTLESLGPFFVKLGQTISTRPDLFPADIIFELSKLQDNVPPFDGKIAIAIIEDSLGATIAEKFAQFDERAMASASVAQVHAATLYDGKKVIVKVLRPNVEIAIKRDIELMYLLARLIDKTKDGRRLRAEAVVKEFEYTTDNELDLMNEAAACTQLRANFKNSDMLYVPEIYWQYCRRQIMVMERVQLLNISEMDKIRAAGTNLKVLAERGVEIFFTQVFRDSFFHADMHPGNIFIDISNPDKPSYCAVDFGIMGSLTPEDQHYLAENFLAFFNRDYRRVAQLHIESGWVPKDTRITDFENAIRKVSEPIFGKPIKDISFGAFLLTLFQTARRFNMHIQPQLVLLQKTFFNVEGLGRRLYPELDLWKTAKPVLEAWMKGQIGPKSYLKNARKNAHEYAQTLPQIPILLSDALKYYLRDDNKKTKNNFTANNYNTLAAAACLISSATLFVIHDDLSIIKIIALLLLALFGLFFLRNHK